MSKLPYLCILPIFPIQKPEKVDLLYTLKTMPAFAITSGKCFIFAFVPIFSPCKTPKKVLFLDKPTVQWLRHRMLVAILCGNVRSIGVPFAIEVFLCF